jgi:phosphohistidine phosphatase
MFSSMLRLLLLRHAKSDWSQPGQKDQDRLLARRGRRTAPEIGAYMARHRLIPDRVLCSTAQRTRQTLELVAEKFSAPPPVTFEDGLYNATPDGILQAIRATPREIRTLLVIGHNPGLQAAATALIASGDVEARERLKEKLPTAGLAVIDFPVDDWGKLHRKSGRLERFVTPRMLETATD